MFVRTSESEAAQIHTGGRSEHSSCRHTCVHVVRVYDSILQLEAMRVPERSTPLSTVSC